MILACLEINDSCMLKTWLLNFYWIPKKLLAVYLVIHNHIVLPEVVPNMLHDSEILKIESVFIKKKTILGIKWICQLPYDYLMVLDFLLDALVNLSLLEPSCSTLLRYNPNPFIALWSWSSAPPNKVNWVLLQTKLSYMWFCCSNLS